MDRHHLIDKLFATPRALIGMIHVGALPGSPKHREDMNAIVSRAVTEARIYHDAGFHALLIENMHDRPYPKGAADPATVAAMAVVGCEISLVSPRQPAATA